MVPLTIVVDLEQTGFRADLPDEDLRALLERQNNETAKVQAVGLMRNGTSGGRAVVHLLIRMPDGTPVIAETTLRLARIAALGLAQTPVYAEEDFD